MPKPWETRGSGTIYTPPVDPLKTNQDNREERAQRLREAEAARQAAENDRARQDRQAALLAEMAAKGFQPDGRGGWVPIPNFQKPGEKDEALTPEQKREIAAEARKKLEALNRLEARSRDNWFATGFGSNLARIVPGAPAYDQNADIETVTAAGALAKVLAMAQANGGKNPLTPLSGSDVTLIGKSVANLDQGQSDENFQTNARDYRDLYTRVLAGVEPNARELRPPPGVINGVDNRQGVATGSQRWEPDTETNNKAWEMWRNGASLDQISAYYQQRGYRMGPIRPDTLKYARENPNWNPFESAGRYVPVSTMERLSASPVGGYTSGAATALSFGLNDELYGAANALAGGDYTKARDEFQGRKEAIADMNPVSNVLGNLSGGLMLGGGTAGIGSKFAPGVTSRVLTAARNSPVATGSAYGAVYGAGENNQDRTGGAITGGIGGGLGGALGKYAIGPLAARIGGSGPAQKLANAAEPYIAPIRNRLGGQRVSPAPMAPGERSLTGAIDDFAQVRGPIQDAADMGLPYSLADADPRLRMLAGTVSRKSPEARALAEDLLDPRANDQASRLLSAIDENLAPRTNLEARAAQLREAGSTEAAPFYNMARAQPATADDQVQAYLQTPAGRDALKRAYEIAGNEGRDPQTLGFTLNDLGEPMLQKTPSFETLDLVKRGLDARINEARNPITGAVDFSGNPQLQAIEAMRSGFVGRLDQINPNYPKARAAFSKWAKAADALKAGKSLAEPKVLPRDVENALPRLSDNMGEVQRGYATGLGDTVEKVRYSANPYEAILGSPSARQKLEAIFPQGAPKMNRLYNLERDMTRTRNEVLGGSPTAARLAADEALAPAFAEHGINLVGGAMSGNPGWGTAMRAAAASAKFGLGKAGEKKARDVAPILFRQDPAGLLNYFDDLAMRAKANQAYKQKWQGRAGLFGAGVSAPLINQ